MGTDYKAKYEEALNKARELHGTVAAGRDFLAEIFPELVESEDEKIRRVIHQMMLWMRKETFTSQDESVTKEKVLCWLEKQKEQRPAWSEEDKTKLDNCCAVIAQQETYFDTTFRQKCLDFLYEFPKRFALPSKQEWIEDNLKELTEFEAAMLHIGMSFFGGSAGLNPNNTNEVKKQAKLLLELVPKQEWSEEDEKIAKEIEEELWYPGDFPDYPSKEESELYDDCQRRLDWFKNKLKSLRPQLHTVSIKNANKFAELEYERGVKDGIESEKSRHWKPSEEQMEALNYAIAEWDGGKRLEGLYALRTDLKKLI